MCGYDTWYYDHIMCGYDTWSYDHIIVSCITSLTGSHRMTSLTLKLGKHWHDPAWHIPPPYISNDISNPQLDPNYKP